MRTTIGIATFTVISAGAVGASALSGLSMLGSDTLFTLTTNVIGACSGVTGGTTYTGTGSSNGEGALKSGAQTISPMSRTLTTSTTGNTCTTTSGSPATSEGLVIALDGVALVGATASSGAAACNGAVDLECDKTDLNAGLAYNKVVTLPDSTTYTLTGWRDVLRIIYAGANQTAGNNASNRDCNSSLRRTIVDNWGNMFQNGCTGGTCTQLRHAFRRDDESGTTDVFLAVLGLGSINITGRVSPFCNALLGAQASPAIGRYMPDYQDNDPIRRTCAGSNSGASPSTTSPHEQVCSRLGNLGVVLPVPPVDYLTQAQAYNTNVCSSTYKFGEAPRNYPSGNGLCPNGDVVVFGNQCLVPVDASGNAGCFAGKTTKPQFVFGSGAAVDGVTPTASTMDGRVYNLHLYAEAGTYRLDRRNRPIQGAFHRIHSTRTMNNPSNVAACQERDATSQIGCLVQASPCSIGFAGQEATVQTGVIGLKVNSVDPISACIQNFSYPLTRKLYVNSMVGLDAVTGDELAIAKCFSGTGLTAPATINSLLATSGFVALPAASPNAGAPYCEDFDERYCSNTTYPTNGNACANNDTQALPAVGTTCGNGTVEFAEECDQGDDATTGNGTATSTCTKECRNK